MFADFSINDNANKSIKFHFELALIDISESFITHSDHDYSLLLLLLLLILSLLLHIFIIGIMRSR